MIIKDFQDIKSFFFSNLNQDESLLEIVVEDALVIVIDIIKGLADIAKSHENQYSNDTQNYKKNNNSIYDLSLVIKIVIILGSLA